MHCAYCGVEITDYPDSGICTHCGGKLPKRPAGIRCESCGNYSTGNFCSVCGRNLNSRAVPPQPAPAPVQTVYIPHPGGVCCPKCGSYHVAKIQRGYSWGWGLFWCFMIPVFGLLLGFCGSKKPRYKCTACGRKWKPV